jgi:hypothetical protein
VTAPTTTDNPQRHPRDDLHAQRRKPGSCVVILNGGGQSAEVMHLGGHATARSPVRMVAAHHDSAYRYLADRHQGLRWALVVAGIKAGLAVRLKLETGRLTRAALVESRGTVATTRRCR